ncbi:MAG: hypothetical protein JSV47_10720 [Deltaproteobacteria bacterium]|nr:MAG: hypothetical protein JSV47_10720 [Deltaproteobacteria bacterium]
MEQGVRRQRAVSSGQEAAGSRQRTADKGIGRRVQGKKIRLEYESSLSLKPNALGLIY